jgi:hypothetical protein
MKANCDDDVSIGLYIMRWCIHGGGCGVFFIGAEIIVEKSLS